MNLNRIKHKANSVMLDTPFVSIGIALITIFLALIVSNNAWVREFYVSEATLILNNDQKATVVVEIDADTIFANGLKNAYWFLENSAERQLLIFEEEEYVDDRLVVTYTVPPNSLNNSELTVAGIPVKVEIEKRKIKLIERMLGDIFNDER